MQASSRREQAWEDEMVDARRQRRSRSQIESEEGYWDRHERGHYPRSNQRSEFDRDLAAMGKVWSMIRQGAARMLGEIGRQY